MPVWLSLVVAGAGGLVSLALALIAWLLRSRLEMAENTIKDLERRIVAQETKSAIAGALDPVKAQHADIDMAAVRAELKEIKSLITSMRGELTAHISREDGVMDRLEQGGFPIQAATNGPAKQ